MNPWEQTEYDSEESALRINTRALQSHSFSLQRILSLQRTVYLLSSRKKPGNYARFCLNICQSFYLFGEVSIYLFREVYLSEKQISEEKLIFFSRRVSSEKSISSEKLIFSEKFIIGEETRKLCSFLFQHLPILSSLQRSRSLIHLFQEETRKLFIFVSTLANRFRSSEKLTSSEKFISQETSVFFRHLPVSDINFEIIKTS